VRESLLRPRDTIFAGQTAIRLAAKIEQRVLLDSLPDTPGELLPWQQN
jgi:hypothetical protein